MVILYLFNPLVGWLRRPGRPTFIYIGLIKVGNEQVDAEVKLEIKNQVDEVLKAIDSKLESTANKIIDTVNLLLTPRDNQILGLEDDINGLGKRHEALEKRVLNLEQDRAMDIGRQSGESITDTRYKDKSDMTKKTIALIISGAALVGTLVGALIGFLINT